MGQASSRSPADAERPRLAPSASRRSSFMTGLLRRSSRRTLSRASSASIATAASAPPMPTTDHAEERDARAEDSAIVESACGDVAPPSPVPDASIDAPEPPAAPVAALAPPEPLTLASPARRIVVQGTISSMPAPLSTALAPVVPSAEPLRQNEEAVEARTASAHPSAGRARSASVPSSASPPVVADVPASASPALPPFNRQRAQGDLIARLLTVAAATTAASLLPGRIQLNGRSINGFPGIDSNRSPDWSTSSAASPGSPDAIEADPLREAIRQAIRDSSADPSATATMPAQAPAEPGFDTFLLDLQTHVGAAIAETLEAREDAAELERTAPMTVLERLAERWDAVDDEAEPTPVRSTSLSFFRMHRFAERNLQLATPAAPDAPAPAPLPVVPVLLVGVRSLQPGETVPMLESMSGPGSRSAVTASASSSSSAATPTFTRTETDEEDPSPSTDDDEPDEEPAPPPPTAQTVIDAVAAAYPSWLIWIAGGVYQPNHPLLAMPALLSGFDDASIRSGQAYDELLRLAELLGSGKPATATKDQLAAAGLDIVTLAEARDRIGQCLGDTAGMCQICRDDYADDDRIRLLNCRHAFHADCVDTWLTGSSVACPLCRTAAVDLSAPVDKPAAPVDSLD